MDISVTPLDGDTFNSLLLLVFPSDVPQVTLDIDLENWRVQGFTFTKGYPGIFQPKNGPCGLLAAVHALMIKDLIFDSKIWLDPQQVLTEEQMTLSLSRVFSAMLDRASGGGKIQVVLNKTQTTFTLASSDNLMLYSTQNRKSVEDVIRSNMSHFLGEGGAVLLLYSLVLTKGFGNLTQDLQSTNSAKMTESSLIVGQNGLCSQALVSLAVFGQAIADVADESFAKYTGPIHIGLLTFEEVENLTFGSGFAILSDRLKHPAFPVWIIHGGDHYTTLFGFSQEILSFGAPKKSGLDSGKCANGCGFYATQEFYGYCSSCYKKVGEKAVKQADTGNSTLSEPVKCKNNCGFYGNDKCFGFCSVCWKSLPPDQQAKIQLEKSVGTKASEIKTVVQSTYAFTVYHFNGLPPPGPHLAPISLSKSSESKDFQSPLTLTNISMVVQRKWVSDNPGDDTNGRWEFEVAFRFSEDERKQYSGTPSAQFPNSVYSSAFVLPGSQQWRCSTCVVNQIFSQNPPGVEICTTCGQHYSLCGHTVWVKYENLSNLLKREVDSRYSPKLVSLLHIRWPFTQVDFCGKKPPTI